MTRCKQAGNRQLDRQQAGRVGELGIGGIGGWGLGDWVCDSNLHATP